MNDLKESHETLHRAADELKTTIGAIDKDKYEWVHTNIFLDLKVTFYFRQTNLTLQIWMKKFVIWRI